MNLYVQTDDPRNPYEVVSIKEDRSAYAYAGVFVALAGAVGWLIWMFI